jgi:transposase
MGKPHPIELRARVVAFVEEGNTNREAARHFRVSPRFGNTIVILKRASCGGDRLQAAQASWIYSAS